MPDAEEKNEPGEKSSSEGNSGAAGAPKKDGEEAPKLGPDGKPIRKLTPEEQLAAYEESLKNDDWGHQPC